MSIDQTSPPNWPWAGWWPGSWVPQNLSQPILQGWTFNINRQNSSAPQTEAEIVGQHSYGRQLGRLSDALEALIEAGGLQKSKDKRLVEFVEMKAQIDQLKLDAAEARIERLRSDLAALKAARPDEHRRLRDALKRALDG